MSEDGEYGIDKEFQEQQEQKINSLLENVLSEEVPEEKRNTREKRKFKPKFNVREEFVVWMRQEFPELNDYEYRNEPYKELIQRKEEVLDGARQACEHGVRTTGGCTRGYFKDQKKTLSQWSESTFTSNIRGLISNIEIISSNLR